MSRPHHDSQHAASPSRRFADLDVEHTTDPETRSRVHVRRRRRRTLQRCSVVLATLFVGATQCDPAPSGDVAATPADAGSAPAGAGALAPVVSAPDAPAPVAPHAAGPAVAEPAAVPAPEPSVAVEPIRIPGPDGTAEHGRCTQYEDLLMIHAPEVGWDALRMSRLAWRESNCWAGIRSRTSDTGLLQINDITLEFLNEALGEPVDRWTLTDPIQNIRAAAALCTFWETNGSSCYQPWRQN